MALASTHHELDDLGGGKFRTAIHMRADVAYLEDGVFKRSVPLWVPGDASFPHVVDRAGLMCRTGPDGMRRLYPTRDPNKYLAVGAPYIPDGARWKKWAMGAASKSAGLLSWSTAAADLSIYHGSNQVKLEVLLKSAAAKAVGRVAFPFDLVGLTYSKGTLYDNGKPVMQLRAPVAYDAANPMDVRPIAWNFANVAGQQYLILTLPSLTGMAQPVVDPTLVLQPDPTDGDDCWGWVIAPNNNYATFTTLRIYTATGGGTQQIRSFIRFNLSSLPAGAIVTAVTLSLWEYAGYYAGTPTVRLSRILDANDWVEAAATWNNRKTATGWAGSVGCQTSGTDYDATSAATAVPCTGVDETEVPIIFDANGIADVQAQAIGTNQGFVMYQANGLANEQRTQFASSDYTVDPTKRPMLTVVYELPGAGGIFRSAVMNSAIFGGSVR